MITRTDEERADRAQADRSIDQASPLRKQAKLTVHSLLAKRIS
jgi:hypothetical protein